MLIALLLVLGVDLVVIVAFVASILARKRWIRQQIGAFRGAIRVADGELDGLRPTWSRGYGRWVRDVLVWTKAPFLFRTELVPVDELTEESTAQPGEIKRLGAQAVVVAFEAGEATIDVAADGDQVDLLRGPFAGPRTSGTVEPPGLGEAPPIQPGSGWRQ
jgi:Protein of unknown function (DUF2550)